MSHPDLRPDTVLFHTAFDCGSFVTPYLNRNELRALSIVSKPAHTSIDYVIKNRGIAYHHPHDVGKYLRADGSPLEPPLVFSPDMIWTVALEYKGDNINEFLDSIGENVIWGLRILLEYIIASKYITHVVQFEHKLEITFACGPVDLDDEKQQIDKDYIIKNIGLAIIRLYEANGGMYYEHFDNIDVRHEYFASKMGKKKRNRRSRKRK